MKAFDIIAGSSLGGISNRDFAIEIIARCDEYLDYETMYQFWRDMAECSDSDDYIENGDCINDAMQLFNDQIELPEFCQLTMRDNEAIIIPCLESAKEECHLFDDEAPSIFAGDHVLSVNDHGNVTCYQWKPYSHINQQTNGEYIAIWDMV